MFRRAENDQFSHETEFSDGEVYRKIRHYRNNHVLKRHWLTQLTPSKKSSILTLLSNWVWVKALEPLLDFPGLWEGLQLGNVRRHLALHFDQAIMRYLERIFKTWNIITLSDPAVRMSVDIQTVRQLQCRTPRLSIIDRNFIIHGMEHRTLFPKIVDPNLREHVQASLLSLTCIIPTIRSFHENLKLLEIGAKIVKTQLLETFEPIPREITLYDRMCALWSPPNDMVTEVSREERQRLAVRVVFAFILDHFASLSVDSPRNDKKTRIKGAVDHLHQVHLLKQAYSAGFRSGKIGRGLLHEDSRTPLPSDSWYNEDGLGEGLERRWGRPFAKAYRKLSSQLSLPPASPVQNGAKVNPSVFDVRCDFLDSFFGPSEWVHTNDLAPPASAGPLVPNLRVNDPVSPPLDPTSMSPRQEVDESPSSSLAISIPLQMRPDTRSTSPETDSLTHSNPEALDLGTTLSRHRSRSIIAPTITDGVTLRQPLVIPAPADRIHSLSVDICHPSDNSPRPQSVLANAEHRNTHEGAHNQCDLSALSFTFGEHNGMFHRQMSKRMDEMELYLRRRQGWRFMAIRGEVVKTLRFEHVIRHLIHSRSLYDSYVIVKGPYVEQFRKNLKCKRSTDEEHVNSKKKLRM